MSESPGLEVRSYPERLFGWISLPYWLSIFVAWELVFAADYFLGRSFQESTHLAEFGCLIVFFALVGSTIIYCSRVLVQLHRDLLAFIEDDHATFTVWYQQQLKLAYEGPWPIGFGLVFAVLESLTAGRVIASFTPAGSLALFRGVYEFAGFFLLGMGVWALLCVARIPVQLTRYKIRVSLTQLSGHGIQALGVSYFRMSLSIILTFLPLVLALIISPLGNNMYVLAWLAAGLALIFAFFLLPQVGIHRIMAMEKTQRLEGFTVHLEEAMQRSLKDPSSANMQHLKELFELQGHLKGMNEWPFDTNTIWQLITALLIPLAIAMLDKVF
ncbi:MAG: hypothetical protein JST46_15720 [Bacteroidetes bacterium]|nr:hypothetical protein [Bacteroidota bacterium]